MLRQYYPLPLEFNTPQSPLILNYSSPKPSLPYNKSVLLTPPHPSDSKASQSSPSSPHLAPPPSNTSRTHGRDSPRYSAQNPSARRASKPSSPQTPPPLKPQPIPLLRHHDVQNQQVERRPTRRNQHIQHGAKVEQDSVPIIAGADGAGACTSTTSARLSRAAGGRRGWR